MWCSVLRVECVACCVSFVLVSHLMWSGYIFSSLRKKYISIYNTREINMLRHFVFHPDPLERLICLSSPAYLNRLVVCCQGFM